jgi:hypothetical protein
MEEFKQEEGGEQENVLEQVLKITEVQFFEGGWYEDEQKNFHFSIGVVPIYFIRLLPSLGC